MLLKKTNAIRFSQEAITSLKYSTASSPSLHEGCISSGSLCLSFSEGIRFLLLVFLRGEY
jgi:hypothetical protein